MSKKLTTRDLIVLILAIMVGIGVGAIDTLIHVSPDVTDGALSAVLIATTAWTFYRLR